MAIYSETGEVIGKNYHNVSENIYWNSKLISNSGYGNAPEKWFTQGGNVTITSEHPFNKGFSTSYVPEITGSHVTDIDDATASAPHWKGVYTSWGGATNYGVAQNSSIGGGWEGGEGALMKMVYNGGGASNSTNAVRGYIWKNFFSNSAVPYRQSFFYYIESGHFCTGWFAGYAGEGGSTSASWEDSTGCPRHTAIKTWTYVNHAAQSYVGATANNSTQLYLNGFGFLPGTACTAWIAIPGLTHQMRSSGKSINIASAAQQIGQG